MGSTTLLRTTILANGQVTSTILANYLRTDEEFMTFNLTAFEVTRFGE